MRFHKLEESLVNFKALIGLAKPEEYKVASEGAIKILHGSQKFYCGDLRTLPSMKDYTNYPRLPFPIIALEYEGERVLHFAFLIDEIHEGNGNRRPGMTAMFYALYPEGCAYIGSAGFDREESTLSIKNAFDMRTPELIDEGKRLLTQHFFRIGDFLAVLNCVNVKTAVMEASAALNKKRMRNGKVPIYSYKILVLKPSAARGEGLGGTHESPRIHLRRGHIKHRKTGDFWWQPCVVGDRARGVVMKDYRADKLVAAA